MICSVMSIPTACACASGSNDSSTGGTTGGYSQGCRGPRGAQGCVRGGAADEGREGPVSTLRGRFAAEINAAALVIGMGAAFGTQAMAGTHVKNKYHKSQS